MVMRKAYFFGFLLASFWMGAAVGTVYDSLAEDAAKRPKRGRFSRMGELHQKLNMTEEQKVLLDQIVEDGRKQFMALGQETRPKYQMIRMGLREQIRSILDPEQTEQFDTFMEEQDRKAKQRRERHHGAVSHGASECRGT